VNLSYLKINQMKKLTRTGNVIASLIVVVSFFGVYPRELQEGSPTTFALLSILIYSVNKYILDMILLYMGIKELNEQMEEMEEMEEMNKEFDKNPLTPKNLNKD
tara:strand:- start:3649 stop:3960 length:312 start_codon:yes stop_codon:yes gene_type:complete